ncbi:MAG: site-specific integrase [Lachnospiraceae bacterium]|nr:site-specific integrase [Lachnospiraceae bacterium]
MATKRTDSKKRNLKTGEGQREDGRYYYRYTDLLGKRKMVYALTLADLREKEKRIARDLEDGIDSEKGEMTLNELFDLYMGTKTKLKDNTRRNYHVIWNSYVKETDLGEMKISAIRNVHILNFYGKMSKEDFSAGTQQNVHMLLNAMFKMAVKSDYIRKNPADGAAKEISGKRKERKALTRKEQAILMNFVEESSTYKVYWPLLTVFLNTGLREGELCGLRWKDVDFKEGVIHVRQQLLYRNYGDGYKYHLQSLKTSCSMRDIPITAECRKALKMQREYDLLLNIKRQEVEGVRDFVFINQEGKPNVNQRLYTLFKSIVRKYNAGEMERAKKEKRDPVLLPYFSCHILRHCFASRMAESGIEPKTLQLLMGHTDIGTTMNIYTNLDFEEVKKQVANAEKYMNVV